MALSMHPNDTALAHAAMLTQRGANPTLIMPDASTLKTLAGHFLNTAGGYGPAGEDGVEERQAERIHLRAMRAADDGARAICLLENALMPHVMDRVRARLGVDGFDLTRAYDTEAELAAAIDSFVRGLPAPVHADYGLRAALDTYALEPRQGAGGGNWMYSITVGACEGDDGWLTSAAEIVGFTRGRALVADRQDAGGDVRYLLDALWRAAEDVAPPSQVGATGARRARALTDWLERARPHAHLLEYGMVRAGDFISRVVPEIDLRSAMLGGSEAAKRSALQRAQPAWFKHNPKISDILAPYASLAESFASLDELSRALLAHGGAVRDYRDVLEIEKLLGTAHGTDWVEWARLNAPPGATGVEKAGLIADEIDRGSGVTTRAPKPSAAALSGEAPQILDQTETVQLTAAFRQADFKQWELLFLQELQPPAAPAAGAVGGVIGAAGGGAPGGGGAAGGGGWEPNPHRLLAKMFTCPILAVRRFAGNKVATLPHELFQRPAVSAARGHLISYLEEAVMTREDGTPELQRGVRLQLPAAWVTAAIEGHFDKVPFEDLVVLVENALRPISMEKVPIAQHYASTQRADKLLRFGGRLVAAVGRGDNSQRNSFGTVISEWRDFLDDGVTLKGAAREDHVKNGQRFVQDCLRLAAQHGVVMMKDRNPLGHILGSFVPAGAKPFDDLDRHRLTHDQVDTIASSFPSVAKAMGAASGSIKAPGVVSKRGRGDGGDGVDGGDSSGDDETLRPAKKGRRSKARRDASKAAKEKEKGTPPDAGARINRKITVEGATKAPTVKEITEALGLDARANFCWEVVCSPSADPAERNRACPCSEKSGHRGPNAPCHRLPSKLADKYQQLFGRQRATA